MEALTKGQIEQIARETAKIVIRKLREDKQSDEQTPRRMVTLAEAARILGVSQTHVRRIKNMLTHTKVGNHQQGRLLFDASRLLDDYERYQYNGLQ